MSNQAMKGASKEMQRARAFAAGQGGNLHRHPGGFWGHEQWTEMKVKWFGTPTVHGLVLRGLAEYSRWQDGRNGRFPIEITLKPPLCGLVDERGLKCKKFSDHIGAHVT